MLVFFQVTRFQNLEDFHRFYSNEVSFGRITGYNSPFATQREAITFPHFLPTFSLLFREYYFICLSSPEPITFEIVRISVLKFFNKL